jgi:hypothetical protein
VHVTLRARRGLPPFREEVIAREIRRRIAEANQSKRLRDMFRVVHFSVPYRAAFKASQFAWPAE